VSTQTTEDVKKRAQSSDLQVKGKASQGSRKHRLRVNSLTALKLANRAVPIDSIEIFRPVKEAANAAKVIIRGVKTLVALEEKA